MPIIPFREWFDEDWFLTESHSPKINVYEDKGNIVAEAEIPGVKSEDIDVEVEKDRVKIEAKREEKKEEKEKGYFRQEISKGYYKRVIPLPEEVSEKDVKADYKNGVLKVVMKKLRPEEKKKTKVKVNSV